MRSKKTIFNLITSLILKVIMLIHGFIIPRIIIGFFGSDVNGLVVSITQFLAYISLLESGFGPVVKSVLYKPIAENNKEEIEGILKTSNKFFNGIAKIFIVYIVILCIVYPYIVSEKFDAFYTISLILIISISTFAEYYFGMTYRLFLQAKQKTYVISSIMIFTYILSISLVFVLAKIGTNIHLLKFVTGIIFVLRPVMQNRYVKKRYNVTLGKETKAIDIKQKWDGLAQHIAAVVHGNTATTILTLFRTLVEVSIYSVYFLVVRGIKQIILTFTSSVDAAFGDMIAKKEKENLNNKFSMYEVIYLMITTILFTATLILINPFVSVYTKGIADANYVRPIFGILFVIGDYIWALRLPYNTITLAAGHFKETRIGAWVEAILNIVVSLVLVIKFGLEGVAIGTIVSMLVRTIEFITHANKNILHRNVWQTARKMLLVLAQTLLIVFLAKFLPYVEYNSYINWIINAVMVTTLCMVVVFVINVLFNKEEIMGIKDILKGIIVKRRTR